MFRWSYIVPRLLIVLVIFLILRLGLNPLMKYSIVQTAQSAIGSKVEIGTLKSSLLDGDLYLADVQIADPRNPAQNVIEAEHALMNLDRDAFLHRKYVVTEGKVTGIRFGSDRTTDGSLTPGSAANDDVAGSDLGKEMREFGERWLDGFVEQLEGDVREEFETVRVTEDLMRRWPAEYEQVNQDIENWQASIKNLQNVYEEMRVNPLRSVEYYQKRLSELGRLQEEIAQIRAKSERLSQQVVTDREAIARAKKNDEEKIRNALKLENLEPEALSNYLLGEEVVQQVQAALSWVNRGRDMLGIANAKPDVDGNRGLGRWVSFDRQNRPDMLIRKLAFDGLTTHQQKDVSFRGTMQELTTQPKVHGQPTLLTMDTRGGIDLHLEATLDRTTDQDVDHFRVDVPNLAEQQKTLGNPQRLAINVGAGQTVVTMEMNLVDEVCNGTISLRQENVQLTSQVSERLGGYRVAQQLDASLAQVNVVETKVHLSGKIKKPSMRLESNLGPALASGVNGVIQQELRYHGQRLVAQADAKLNQQTARFESYVQQQQQALLQKVALNEEQIQEFKTLVAKRLGGTGTFSARRLLEEKGGEMRNLFLR